MKYTIEKIRRTAEKTAARKNKIRDIPETHSPQKHVRVVDRAVNRAMSEISKTVSKEGMHLVPGGGEIIKKTLTDLLEGNIE